MQLLRSLSEALSTQGYQGGSDRKDMEAAYDLHEVRSLRAGMSARSTEVGKVDMGQMRTKNLKEDKLQLRSYIMSDAAVIYEHLGCDPEMMRYTGWNPYFSLEATENFVADVIRKYESGKKEYSWLITYKGEPVGTIGAYDYDAEQNCIEIGYSIFREYWGNGYASIALRMVKDYLMQEEGIYTLKAWSADANIASKRVLEKAGFVQTKVKEAAINVNGEQFDQAIYEVMK